MQHAGDHDLTPNMPAHAHVHAGEAIPLGRTERPGPMHLLLLYIGHLPLVSSWFTLAV